MIDSNILKIAGAFVAGLAGIIGILWQTRTSDNKLTRSGKCLFGMAIVGVVLALGTQIWDWKKNIEEAQRAQFEKEQETQRAQKRLEAEMHEIRRAVTLFQTPSISFDFACSFDSTDKVFGPYILDLTKRAEAVTSLAGPDFENPDQGLRLHGMNANSFDFRIDAGSPAMPDETNYAFLRQYVLEAVPQIYVFKTPISPGDFVPMSPDVVDLMPSRVPRPDLILKLSPGDVSIEFQVQKRGSEIRSIRVLHSRMNASVLFSSGVIVSKEDLDQCQALICLTSRKEFEQSWNMAGNYFFRCRINNQTIAESSNTNLASPSFTGLTSCEMNAHTNRLIHSFTFRTDVGTKLSH